MGDMWWSWLAAASVSVTDPTDCVDPERFDNELRLLIGDTAVESLDISLEVESNAAERHTTSIVRRDGERLWSRGATFQQVDCPAIPEALALSLHQGLATLPGWAVGTDSNRPGVQGLLAIETSGGVPVDGRFGLRGGPRFTIGRRFGISLAGATAVSPSVSVGSGIATLIHPYVALGGFWGSPEGVRPEIEAHVQGGPLFAFGRGFEVNQRTVLPRAAASVGFGVYPAGPIRLGAFVEMPFVRVALDEIGGGSFTESLVRVGLSVAVVGPAEKKRSPK